MVVKLHLFWIWTLDGDELLASLLNCFTLRILCYKCAYLLGKCMCPRVIWDMAEERRMLYLSGYEVWSPRPLSHFSGSIYNENIETVFVIQ
jgi:hypothetical protein